MLFGEEMQSDYATAAREKGYKGQQPADVARVARGRVHTD